MQKLQVKFFLPNTKYQLPDSNGFTLLEIIVVIALITILTGIMWVDLRSGNSTLALHRSAQLVTQSIERAKTQSFAGSPHEGTLSGGGYGAYFVKSSNSIILFADCDEDKEYDVSGGDAFGCNTATAGNPYDPEQAGEFLLEGGITVRAIKGILGCSGDYNEMSITFLPPDPKVDFFTTFLTSCIEIEIQIENTDGAFLSIFINKLGVMRIQ